MRREVELRLVQAADIEHLAANLRDQDTAELQALGHDPASFHDVVQQSVECSVMRHSVWSPTNELMGICGMSIASGSLLGATGGVPWMLGTPVVPRFGAALNRTTRLYNRAMLERAPLLFNYVHSANSVSVAWLQRVGYTLFPSEPHGPRGELFHRFEQRRV